MTRSATRKRRPEVDLATELQIVKHVESSEEKWSAQLNAVKTELKSEIGQTQQNLRTVETNLSNKLDESVKGVTNHFDTSMEKLDTKMTAQFEKMDKRVSVLERWRWFIIGGAAVLLWMLGNVAFDKVASFFK